MGVFGGHKLLANSLIETSKSHTPIFADSSIETLLKFAELVYSAFTFAECASLSDTVFII